MKKNIARILSCALVLGMLGTAAMAAEVTVPNNTGSVTFSDVVSTETKTLTIDGEQKEVTVYYVADGSTYHMTPGPGVDIFELGLYRYKDVTGGYESLGGGMANEDGTISAEYFIFNDGISEMNTSLNSLSTLRDGEEVYFMLDGTQSANATPAPTTPADTTATAPAAPASEMVTLTSFNGAANMYGTVAIENARGEAGKIDMKNLGFEGTIYYVPANAKVTAVIENAYDEKGSVLNVQTHVLRGNGYDRVDNLLMPDGTLHEFNRSTENFFDFKIAGEYTFTLPTTPYLIEITVGDPLEFGVTGDTYYIMPDAAPVISAPTAAPSSCATTLDGEAINLNAYLFPEEGGGANYVMLRDIAQLLSGTKAQFEVTWSASQGIVLTTGKAYTPVGGELQGKGDGNKAYVPNASTITIDGKAVELTAYTIGGNNYFKLRDLGAALGFNVGWEGATGTVTIDSTQPYSGTN